MADTVTIRMRDGAEMGGEIAPAAGGRGTGILIVPAIYGIDAGVRETMADWAARGCTVAALDLFHRTVPGPLGREGADKDKAQKRYAEFDAEQGVADLGDAVAWLRAHPACDGKVVVFGYCFGGRYAYLAATRLGVDGAVSFHGTKIGLNLDEAKNVACPLSIHVGDKDPSIPMAEVEATQKALAGVPGVEIRVYPGCVHGFTGKGRPSYDAAADAASTAAAEAIVRSLSAREPAGA